MWDQSCAGAIAWFKQVRGKQFREYKILHHLKVARIEGDGPDNKTAELQDRSNAMTSR